MTIRKITNDKTPNKIIRETPNEMPKQEGEALIYHCGLLPDAIANYLTVCGVDFQKYTVPAAYGSAKSRNENQNLIIRQTKQYIQMSKNQLSFLVSEAKKSTLEYTDKDGKIVRVPFSNMIFFKEEKKETIEAIPLSVADLYTDDVKTDGKKKSN